MRTAKEDIATIGEYGVWEDERDPLLNACVLLVMYAKGRHKPTMNLHRLANALEEGDMPKAQKFYDRLSAEVASTLKKYPDIVETLDTMSQLSDEDMERIDEVMRDPSVSDD